MTTKSALVSFQIADNCYLVRQSLLPDVAPVTVKVSTHHLFVIDVSGSMYGSLPQIRTQLKQRIRDLVEESDLVSIIWFSGRGECGVLVDAEKVATLPDLSRVHSAIDKWLQPVGLTGFKEPLDLVSEQVQKVLKSNPGIAAALCFMSDGMDNQWSSNDILSSAKKASSHLARATVFEWGWYADHSMLQKIAQTLGGSLAFAKDFNAYAPAFEAAVKNRPSGAKKIPVHVNADVIGKFVFSFSDKDLSTYTVEAGDAYVPEGTVDIFYLSPTPVNPSKSSVGDLAEKAANNSKLSDLEESTVAATYAALSLYSQRVDSDTCLRLLRALGDSALIDNFAGCFGKQKFTAFSTWASKAALGTDRFNEGRDPNRVPNDDAFTVLDLLLTLAEDDSNRVLLDHPDWQYSVIGRSTVDASDQFTTEEQAEITKLESDILNPPPGFDSIQASLRIASIKDSKRSPLEFVADPAPNGYPVNTLTFNSGRPNVSLQIVKSGTVNILSRVTDLHKELAASKLKNDSDEMNRLSSLVHSLTAVPLDVKTRIIRNYAIVADGIVNVDKLPLLLGTGSRLLLENAGIIPRGLPSQDPVVIDLTKLPVINRKMVSDVSAKKLFLNEFEFKKVAGARKVFKYYLDSFFPKAAKGIMAEKFGSDAALWLKENGISDDGFSPSRIQSPPTDEYQAREMSIHIPGLSDFPKVEDAISAKKANAAVALMSPAIKEVEDFLKKHNFDPKNPKPADLPKLGLFEKFLHSKVEGLDKQRKSLLTDAAQAVFVIIVGQKWPSEFSDMGDLTSDQEKEAKKRAKGDKVKKRIAAKGELTLDLDGQSTKVELKLWEVDVAI